MVTKGIVLGRIVSANGIELIAKPSTPKTIKDVCLFLGHADFYKRIMKNFSSIAKSMCNLLLKDAPLEWNAKCKKAFATLKHLLTTAPIIYANARLELGIRTHVRCK